MKNDTIAERLNQADALLSERRFDEAVALATSLEETVAAFDTQTASPSRVPTWFRDRLQSLRWAAEIGRQLAYLAGPHTDQQAGTPWRHAGISHRRELGLRKLGLRITGIQ